MNENSKYEKIIFIISLLITLSASAQEDIITDRPDQTESASVVPVKGVQFETGFVLEMDETASYELENFICNSSIFRAVSACQKMHRIVL